MSIKWDKSTYIALILTSVFMSKLQADQIYCESVDPKLAIFEVRKSVIKMDRDFSIYANELDESIPLTDTRNIVSENIYNSCLRGMVNKSLLKNLTVKELHTLYNSLSSLYFYSTLVDILFDIDSVIEAKKQRNENIDRFVLEQFHRYITAREYILAQEIVNLHPDLTFPPIPDIAHNGPLVKGVIQAKNQKLTVVPFTYASEKHLVIIGSPYCNASIRFFSWLHNSSDLVKKMNKNSMILLNESMFPDFNTLERLENLTSISTKQVYKSKQFPEIKYWGTPSFYYVEKGVVKDRYEGWPHKKAELKFKEFLKRNALLKSNN